VEIKIQSQEKCIYQTITLEFLCVHILVINSQDADIENIITYFVQK